MERPNFIIVQCLFQGLLCDYETEWTECVRGSVGVNEERNKYMNTLALLYQIISYHVLSCHLISFISYHIISYHIISYHNISYHIISLPCSCDELRNDIRNSVWVITSCVCVCIMYVSCMYVCMSVCQYVSMSVCQYVSMSVCQYVSTWGVSARVSIKDLGTVTY